MVVSYALDSCVRSKQARVQEQDARFVRRRIALLRATPLCTALACAGDC